MDDTTQDIPNDAAGKLHAATELRRVVAERMATKDNGQTFDATTLVDDAYPRPAGPEGEKFWSDRGHFFAAAAEAMRHTLVDRVRRRNALKQGGGSARADDPEDLPEASDDRGDDELLAVHEALGRLAEVDPLAAELVKLRYFAGLSIPEAATMLDVPPRTADRLWTYARAWLRTAIGES